MASQASRAWTSVLVQHLVLEGSLDARMAQTLVDKQMVIDQALDTAGPSADRDQVIAAVSAELAEDEEDRDMVEAEVEEVAPEVVQEPQDAVVSEPVEAVAGAVEAALMAEVPSPVPERPRRGRPPKVGGALSQRERTRAWKASRKAVGIDVPGALAERMRTLRDERGLTTEQLLVAAMDALDRVSARQ